MNSMISKMNYCELSAERSVTAASNKAVQVTINKSRYLFIQKDNAIYTKNRSSIHPGSIKSVMVKKHS